MKRNNSLRMTPLADGRYEIHITPCKVCRIAEFYGVDPKTMRKRIRCMKSGVGERIGHYYTPRQVEMIIGELGIPSRIAMGAKVAQENNPVKKKKTALAKRRVQKQPEKKSPIILSAAKRLKNWLFGTKH